MADSELGDATKSGDSAKANQLVSIFASVLNEPDTTSTTTQSTGDDPGNDQEQGI